MNYSSKIPHCSKNSFPFARGLEGGVKTKKYTRLRYFSNRF
jgi:hypothetical protein